MLMLLGHGGGTDCTYASGFGCLVFSMDINQFRSNWEMTADLGAYYLFLGLNNPIMLLVGCADVSPGYLTKIYFVYTLPNAAWLSKMSLPEMCRFSLNGKQFCLFPNEHLGGRQGKK
jgi:hypothetical protein